MKKCHLILGVLILIGYHLPAAKLQFKEKFRLTYNEDHLLLVGGGLALTPDKKFYLIPDFKSADIKIFSSSGQLSRVEGRKGVGPDELLSPFKCTGNDKHFALLDFGRRRYFVYEFVTPGVIKRVDEGMQVSAAFDCCLDDDRLIIAATYIKPDGEVYDLYRVGLKDKKITCLVPGWVKYGLSSAKEYEGAYSNRGILPIGIQGYCDADNGYVYYAWEGNLRIMKVNIHTGEIDTFGEKTGNYVMPKVSNRLANAYAEGDRKVWVEERHKLNYIDDINVSKNYIVLSYIKPDPSVGMRIKMLQIYGHNQKLITEFKAPNEVLLSDNGVSTSLSMDRKNDRLIFLKHFLDKNDEDAYEIVIYDIVQ